jgi:hypothetical protein
MHRVTVWVCASILLSAIASAQAPPKAPFIRKDACPLECCALGAWVTHVPLQTYKTEGNYSAKAFLLKSGEEFLAAKGDLHTVQFGFVTVMRPVEKQRQKFSPGDILYVMSYQAYDYYLWLRGRTLASQAFWDTSGADRNGVLYKQAPVMVWWVQVKNAEGQAAWLPLQLRFNGEFVEVAEEIDNMDDCG